MVIDQPTDAQARRFIIRRRRGHDSHIEGWLDTTTHEDELAVFVENREETKAGHIIQ